PDGGWGWMVVFAYGMANIMIVPVLQSFGLIFKDTFKQINISATDASLIINLASAVGMTFGLFNGPLLRNFGFRKVATLGGCMFSIGLMFTSSAETFFHFILTYSIMASLGMGFCNSSFSLALNTYFVMRRNKAAGIAMTITGLGPILLPQLVSFLVFQYGSRSCLLIIGALATHIVAAALLLQPVKRHMIPAEIKDDQPTAQKEDIDEKYSAIDGKTGFFQLIKLSPDCSPLEPNVGSKSRKTPFIWALFDERHPSASRRSSHASVREFGVPMHVISHPKLPVLSENQDLTDDNRMPSIMRQLENTTSPKSSVQKTTKFNISSTDGKGESSHSNVEKRRSLSQKIVTLFDLTLLRDRIYVNMMLGMSIAVFAEINFSLLTPFILNDLGYETEQIASIMSTLAVADLMFRFISPFIGDSLKLTPRVMYMIALSLLILTRFSILIARNYTEMIVVAFFLGVAKGVRTVYMGLVIPSYIPLKRLPAASSIQMMTNGIILMTIGPLVGLIRDLSGSYSKSILFINAFTIVTLIMWAVEMIYVRRRAAQKQREAAAQEVIS
ncbi:AAEL007047-PA, partial [Aedes aegypti]